VPQQINLQDLIQPGDTFTVVFSDTTSVTGVFQSWRDNFKYMVVFSDPDTHVIAHYNYFTVTI
jgi:hypothetical protein